MVIYQICWENLNSQKIVQSLITAWGMIDVTQTFMFYVYSYDIIAEVTVQVCTSANTKPQTHVTIHLAPTVHL